MATYQLLPSTFLVLCLLLPSLSLGLDSPFPSPIAPSPSMSTWPAPSPVQPTLSPSALPPFSSHTAPSPAPSPVFPPPSFDAPTPSPATSPGNSPSPSPSSEPGSTPTLSPSSSAPSWGPSPPSPVAPIAPMVSGNDFTAGSDKPDDYSSPGGSHPWGTGSDGSDKKGLSGFGKFMVAVGVLAGIALLVGVGIIVRQRLLNIQREREYTNYSNTSLEEP